MTAPEMVEVIAGVLAGHQIVSRSNCECGQRLTFGPFKPLKNHAEAHAAHQAAAVLATLTEAGTVEWATEHVDVDRRVTELHPWPTEKGARSRRQSTLRPRRLPAHVPMDGGGDVSAQPVECYPDCPCGRCQVVRREAHDTRWSSLSLHERVQESLNAKIEGDNGRMPEKGMFNCQDIQALLDIVRNQT